MIMHRGKVGEIYNIAGEQEVSNVDLVRLLLKIFDRHGQPEAEWILRVSDRTFNDFRYEIDDGKLRKELGWRQSVSLDEGLQRTVGWYRDHGLNGGWWDDLRCLDAAHAVSHR